MTPRNEVLSLKTIDYDRLLDQLNHAIALGQKSLLDRQSSDGYWVDVLEADSTITSESLLLRAYLGERDPVKEEKKVRYLLACQLDDGGWPIFPGGESNISATVKAYFALKLAGLTPDDPPMIRARERILFLGGLSQVNVFTKITLALFGQFPWEEIPTLPAEVILLPPGRFFSLYDVSYWSRTVIVPLLIIFAHRPVRELPASSGLAELVVPGRSNSLFEKEPGWLTWRNLFVSIDRWIKRYDRHHHAGLRTSAIERAHRWMVTRMQGEGGLGAIYPAMANSVIALRALGYPMTHPLVKKALSEIDALEVDRGETMFVQPCHSVIWDTALTLNTLMDADVKRDDPAIQRGAQWLLGRQVGIDGDWKVKVPKVTSGGWYFQFENAFYPDNDDTAVVLLALYKALGEEGPSAPDLERGVNWLLAMQGSDGGWGAFDTDNNKLFLNNIPFADHGALLDPSTADVTGRVLELLGHLGYDRSYPPVRRALAFIKAQQESFGGWYGRWGVNYIYGTWSVLAGLRAIREPLHQAYIQRSLAWLRSVQNPDGGWGESCESYQDSRLAGIGPSTPSQTAWAVMALLHGGDGSSESLSKGVGYLLEHQEADGLWSEDLFTGTGFPRVFYLRYHMYCQHFPLWALALYRSRRFKGQTEDNDVRLVYRTRRRSRPDGTPSS